VANLLPRFVEGTDCEFSEFSQLEVYDLGQAVARMSLEARALGGRVRGADTRPVRRVGQTQAIMIGRGTPFWWIVRLLA
jgi:hypothetical protein